MRIRSDYTVSTEYYSLTQNKRPGQDGKSVLVYCQVGSTVSECLLSAIAQMEDLVAEINSTSHENPDNLTLFHPLNNEKSWTSGTILNQTLYVRECVQNSIVPEFFLTASNRYCSCFVWYAFRVIFLFV